MNPPYTLYADTPCFVRVVGTKRWTATKIFLPFVCGDIKSWNDAGTHAILEHNGFEYMVHKPFLEGQRQQSRRPKVDARKLHRFLAGGNRQKTRKRSRGVNGPR